MEARDFKALFGEVAKAHGFTAAHGGWCRDACAALVVLNLQKSNFGNHFDLNIKLFLGRRLQGAAADLKSLVKNEGGDVFRRQPTECNRILNLDAPISAEDRRCELDRMFVELVDRITAASATQAGILGLRDEGVLFLLPMAEKRLMGD
jgi:hypothetical protein